MQAVGSESSGATDALSTVNTEASNTSTGLQTVGDESQSAADSLGAIETKSTDSSNALTEVQQQAIGTGQSMAYLKGQTDKATGAAVRTARTNETVGRTFQQVGTRTRSLVRGLVAVVAGYRAYSAAKTAINNTTELAKSTLALHRTTGLDIKTSSRWVAIMKARGASTTQLGVAFAALSKNVRAAGQGSEKPLQAFADLGITQKDLKEGAADLETLLPKLADGFGALGGGVDKVALSQQVFGRGGRDLIAVLGQGNKALQEQLALADKYHVTFSGKSVKSVRELIQAEKELKFAQLGLQVQFSQFLAPALTQGLQKVNDFAREVGRVFRDDSLTPEQKFSKVGDIISDKLSAAAPQIADAAGRIGPKVALGFIRGFIRADTWGQLATGAFLISRLVGWGSIFRAAGKRGATAFASFFIPGAAAGGAAGGTAGATAASATSRWRLAGLKSGKTFGKFMIAGAVGALFFLGVELGKELRKQLNKIRVKIRTTEIDPPIGPTFQLPTGFSVETRAKGGPGKGQLAVVGEEGPELVSLPVRSRVREPKSLARRIGIPGFAKGGAIGSPVETPAQAQVIRSPEGKYVLVTGGVRPVAVRVADSLRELRVERDEVVDLRSVRDRKVRKVVVGAVHHGVTRFARGGLAGTEPRRESPRPLLARAAESLTRSRFAESPAIRAITERFTQAFQSGGTVQRPSSLAVVGEEGPELVSLPVGSYVHSNPKSKKIAKRLGIPGFAKGGWVGKDEEWEFDPMLGPGNQQVPGFAQGGYVREIERAVARATSGPPGPAGPEGAAPGKRNIRTFLSTAYGPPWGGIQGTGTTKTGIDLRPARQAYIVAVDPSVIPLHSRLTAHPNPFRRTGTFGAEDIGGAIKGNRIDFYDWRGRASQNAWGKRIVSVDVKGKGGSIPGLGAGGGGGGKGPRLAPVETYEGRANYLERLRLPYIWGGHHGDRGRIKDPRPGLDCSSAVSYVLGIPPRVSGGFASWGKKGKGPITVYGNSGHVFMNIKGRGFGTSKTNPKGGAGWLDYATPEEAGGFPGGGYFTRHTGVGEQEKTTVRGVTVRGKVTFGSLLDALRTKLEAGLATARLSKRPTDDIRALKKLVAYWKGLLKIARKNRNYEQISEAATNLKSNRDELTEVRQTIRDKRKEKKPDPELFEVDGLTSLGTGKNAFQVGGLQQLVDSIDLETARARLTVPPEGKEEDQTAVSSSLQDDIAAATKFVSFWDYINNLASGMTVTMGNKYVPDKWVEGTVQQKAEAADKLASARGKLKSLRDDANKPAEKSETDSRIADLLRQQLEETRKKLAVSETQTPIFQRFNLPKFHEGGIVKGPIGGDVPAVLRPREGVFTEDQMAALAPAQPSELTVIIEDGAVDPNKIRVVANDAIAEQVRKARSGPAIGRKVAFQR